MFALIRLGHEHLDVAPDHLSGGIAENALDGRIEGLDDTALIDGDDAVHHGVEDRSDARIDHFERTSASLRRPHLPPDQKIDCYEQNDQRQRGEHASRDRDLLCAQLLGTALFQQPALLFFHLAKHLKIAVPRLPHRGACAVSARRFEAFSLAQQHRALGKRDALVYRFPQSRPALLLAGIVGSQLHDPAQRCFPRRRHRVAFGEWPRVARNDVTARNRLNKKGGSLCLGEVIKHLLGVGHLERCCERVTRHLPCGGGERRDHKHGGGERGQHLGFETELRVHCVFLCP